MKAQKFSVIHYGKHRECDGVYYVSKGKAVTTRGEIKAL